MPLLEKTLKLQREAGENDRPRARRRCSSSWSRTPRSARPGAARPPCCIAGRGDTSEAAELLHRRCRSGPPTRTRLPALCEIWARAEVTGTRWRRCSRRTLPELPPADATGRRARRARACGSTWRAEAQERRRGRDRGFEKVVELEPAHVGARVALGALYGDRPELADAAIQNHRMLLAEDITRADSLRALGNAYARRGMVDRARCCFEVLALLGGARGRGDRVPRDPPGPALKADDPYAWSSTTRRPKAHLAPPEATVMGEISRRCRRAHPASSASSIEDYGVTPQDKISPMSDLDLGKDLRPDRKALGNKKTALYLKTTDSAPTTTSVQIVVQAPPALIVGALPGQGRSTAEVRFQLGRGIELTRPEYILAAGVRPKQFAQLFSSVLKAFHPRHSRRRATASDATEELAAKLKKNVPYKVSKRLVELFQELGSTSWSSVRWRAVVHQTGNRAGLLLCGDLRTAARLVAGRSRGDGRDAPEELTLARDWTSEPFARPGALRAQRRYFLLREKIGTAVASAVAA